MCGLTERQREVYETILSHVAATGEAPTYRSLATQLGIRNVNGIACHLQEMAIKGVVEKDAMTMPVGLRERLAKAAKQFLKGK